MMRVTMTCRFRYHVRRILAVITLGWLGWQITAWQARVAVAECGAVNGRVLVLPLAIGLAWVVREIWRDVIASVTQETDNGAVYGDR